MTQLQVSSTYVAKNHSLFILLLPILLIFTGISVPGCHASPFDPVLASGINKGCPESYKNYKKFEVTSGYAFYAPADASSIPVTFFVLIVIETLFTHNSSLFTHKVHLFFISFLSCFSVGFWVTSSLIQNIF